MLSMFATRLVLGVAIGREGGRIVGWLLDSFIKHSELSPCMGSVMRLYDFGGELQEIIRERLRGRRVRNLVAISLRIHVTPRLRAAWCFSKY